MPDDPSTQEDIKDQKDVDPSDVKDADPSSGPDQGDKEPEKSLLDVVNEASQADSAEDEDPGKEDAPSSDDESSSEDGEASAKEGDEQSEEDEKLPPFHEHPRWKQVQEDRKRLRTENEELRTKVDEFEANRERYEEADKFVTNLSENMAANRLTGDDLTGMFNLAAQFQNGKYEDFLRGITPFVQEAQRHMGTRLDEDLQTKVDQGLMVQEAASEIQQRRLQVDRMQKDQQHNAQVAQTKQVEEIQRIASDWEARQAENDPNWSAKSDAIAEQVRLSMLDYKAANGRLPGYQETFDMLETAKSKVLTLMGINAGTAEQKPSKKPMDPMTSGGNKGPTAPSEPKSMLDVVNMASEQMREAS